jgi:hypothetical protein
MVLVKMFMKMMIPIMNRVLVMMSTISSSRWEVSLAELLRQRAKELHLGSTS